MNLSAQYVRGYQTLLKLYAQYTLGDIASSLFALALWGPNISAQFQHQFLLAVLATLNPNNTKRIGQSRRVKTYPQFKRLAEDMIRCAPRFPEYEDYLPIPDWGEVRYQLGSSTYKYFYSSEHLWTYDMLRGVHLLYFDGPREFELPTENTAYSEVQLLLSRQHSLIERISSPAASEDIARMSLGHIECPPESFWTEALAWFEDKIQADPTIHTIAAPYILAAGRIKRPTVDNRDRFIELAYNGHFNRYWFLEHNHRLYPILPRHNVTALLGRWTSPTRSPLAASFSRQSKNEPPVGIQIGSRLHDFIRSRALGAEVFGLARALDPNMRAVGPAFSAVLSIKNLLALVHVIDPEEAGQDHQAHLNALYEQLRETEVCLKRIPLTMGLPLENRRVELRSTVAGAAKAVCFILVDPQLPEAMRQIALDTTVPVHFMTLPEFIGVIDQLDLSSLPEFLSFWSEWRLKLAATASPLDILAAFLESHGTLTTGASDYNGVFLDPGMGDRMRFAELTGFWKLYPPEGYMDDPRAWTVRQEAESCARLASRGFLFGPLYLRISNHPTFLSSPFDVLDGEQVRLADFLMGCLADSLIREAPTIASHRFFSLSTGLYVHFFPARLVRDNEGFRHVRHLLQPSRTWSADARQIRPREFSVRIVFDEDAVFHRFLNPTDRRAEIELLSLVMTAIDDQHPDAAIHTVKRDLERHAAGKPRFQFTQREREASFPEFVRAQVPELRHERRAIRRASQLAKEYGIATGSFDRDSGILALNTLKAGLVADLDNTITALNYESALKHLITNLDALENSYVRHHYTIHDAHRLDVDYDRAARLAAKTSDYQRLSRAFRYLIEKTVQHHPVGSLELDGESIRTLTAQAEQILALYQESDILHYDIGTLQVEVDAEYRVQAIEPDALRVQRERFLELQSQLQLGTVGNGSDAINGPIDFIQYHKALDDSFSGEYGFRFSVLYNVIHVLSLWAHINADVEELPCYSDTTSRVARNCAAQIKDTSESECGKALEFLVLRPEDVMRVIGRVDDLRDVPVWEQKKRAGRYALRPIIRVDDRYLWGPYSVRRARQTWLRHLNAGAVPFVGLGPRVVGAVRHQKTQLEAALEVRADLIVRRFTPHVRPRVRLHRVDRDHPHPEELGDFDVLAFIPESGLLLNIECKDIGQAYCMKDAKTLRETIFGRQSGTISAHSRVERRERHLRDNVGPILSALAWPTPDVGKVVVISIWLSREIYWWTVHPPVKTGIRFTIPELLQGLIEDLLREYSSTGPQRQ